MVHIITEPTTDDVGPCGCFACEKWADCSYCDACAGTDPWAAQEADKAERVHWNREHAGSLADWLYEDDGEADPDDGMLPCPTTIRVPTTALRP